VGVLGVRDVGVTEDFKIRLPSETRMRLNRALEMWHKGQFSLGKVRKPVPFSNCLGNTKSCRRATARMEMENYIIEEFASSLVIAR
jgi:hypothetical protein